MCHQSFSNDFKSTTAKLATAIFTTTTTTAKALATTTTTTTTTATTTLSEKNVFG